MAQEPPLTYEKFIEDFPEFKELPESAVQFQIDMSIAYLCRGAWDPRWYVFALELITAHYLAVRYNIGLGLIENGVRPPTAAIAIATSKSASTNGLSEGSTVNGLVNSGNPLLADFGRTGYGLQYLSLLEIAVPAGSVVYSPDSSQTVGRYDRWW